MRRMPSNSYPRISETLPGESYKDPFKIRDESTDDFHNSARIFQTLRAEGKPSDFLKLSLLSSFLTFFFVSFSTSLLRSSALHRVPIPPITSHRSILHLSTETEIEKEEEENEEEEKKTNSPPFSFLLSPFSFLLPPSSFLLPTSSPSPAPTFSFPPSYLHLFSSWLLLPLNVLCNTNIIMTQACLL